MIFENYIFGLTVRVLFALTKKTSGWTPFKSAGSPLMINAVAPGFCRFQILWLWLMISTICAIMPVVVGLINNDCNVDCTAAFVQDGDGCHDECCGWSSVMEIQGASNPTYINYQTKGLWMEARWLVICLQKVMGRHQVYLNGIEIIRYSLCEEWGSLLVGTVTASTIFIRTVSWCHTTRW